MQNGNEPFWYALQTNKLCRTLRANTQADSAEQRVEGGVTHTCLVSTYKHSVEYQKWKGKKYVWKKEIIQLQFLWRTPSTTASSAPAPQLWILLHSGDLDDSQKVGMRLKELNLQLQRSEYPVWNEHLNPTHQVFSGCALRSASLEVIAYYLRRTAYKEKSHGKSAVFLPSNDTLGPWGYGLLDFDLPGSIKSTPEFPHNEIHLSESIRCFSKLLTLPDS